MKKDLSPTVIGLIAVAFVAVLAFVGYLFLADRGMSEAERAQEKIMIERSEQDTMRKIGQAPGSAPGSPSISQDELAARGGLPQGEPPR